MTTRKPSSSKRKSVKRSAPPEVVEAPAVNGELSKTAEETVPDDTVKNHSCDTADRQSCNTAGAQKVEEDYIEYLGKLPPEIGTMLMLVGVAGVLLPGPIGTPMLVAGAVVFWPKTFAPIEKIFARCCPKIHREGVYQVKRYVSDLNRRFPDDR